MTDRTAYNKYLLDNAFGWQVERPVFVKTPFTAFGRKWQPGKQFNWQEQPCRSEDYVKVMHSVHSLYKTGKIHHDSAREDTSGVGDRLHEFRARDLEKLVNLVNALVKKRSNTAKEARDKSMKYSKVVDKQRGLIRSWVYSNSWALEEYNEIRLGILSDIEKRKQLNEDTKEDEKQE